MKHSSRKFNPGLNEDDASVITNYVVRLPLFEILLETIAQNVVNDICHHRLYYAPRGRGKTMLLARLSAALRTEERFKDSCIPVQLFEENFYEINNIAEFWLEILNTMQITLADSGKSIEQRIEYLQTQWQHPNIGQIAEQAVIEEISDRGKKAVIMVENMHQLLDEVEDDNSFSADLRRVMQNQPELMFVLTATTEFEQLSNANHPFYELFAVSEVPPLTRAETSVLWSHLTNGETQEDESNPGHLANEDLARQENRIAPLHILTGGSPRLLRIMADFGSNHCIRGLLENLSGLIDEHTEYFKSQIEALPTKERRVFVALADLWQDSTASEIASRARMDIRSTAALLNRLVHRGAIRVNTEKKRNKTYLVSERLFSIYYKFRRQRQPETVAKHLVEFMVDFYTSEDVDRIIQNAMKETSLSSLERATLDGLQTRHTDQETAKVNFGELISTEDDNRDIPQQLVKQLAAAKTAYDKGDYEKVITSLSKIITQHKQSKEPALQEQVAEAMFNLGGTYHQQGDTDEAIVQYSALIKRFKQSEEPALQEQVAQAMFNLGGTYAILRDWGEAMHLFEQLQQYTGEISKDVTWRSLIQSSTLLAKKLVNFSRNQPDRTQRYIAAVFNKSIVLSSKEERLTLALACAAFLMAEDSIDVLEDESHDEEIAPITIAVKMINGLPVRGSEEMREIAADVIERVESLREEIIKSA